MISFITYAIVNANFKKYIDVSIQSIFLGTCLDIESLLMYLVNLRCWIKKDTKFSDWFID